MTALQEYVRLESTGLWRATAEAQRIDVYVFVGAASLVIADKSEAPLSHWSLPAIERLNPGVRPALFAPAPDAEETLEIDDAEMINAINRVQKAVRKAEPKPGRLRLWIALGLVSTILGLAIFWMPGAVVNHALSVVPETQRKSLGNRVFVEMQRLTGKDCGTARDARVLGRLAQRLAPENPPTIKVVRDGVPGSVALPGDMIILGRTVVEDHDTPDVAAGYILSEVTRARTHDPLRPLLEVAGTWQTLVLLTTGDMATETLERYADTVLKTARPEPDLDILLSVFEAAGVSTRAYARAMDISGETTLPLLEADPMQGQTIPAVLNDNTWVSVQAICLN